MSQYGNQWLIFFIIVFRADLYNDEEIQQIILYNPEWVALYDEIENKPRDNISKWSIISIKIPSK